MYLGIYFILGILMKNLILNFQILDLKRKFFYEFLTQNNFSNFRFFSVFCQDLNLKCL